MLRDFGVEIPVVGTIRRAVGANLSVATVLTDADVADYVILRRGLVAKEAFLQTNLSLRAQVVVQTGEDDDDLVARVGCLAYQPRVVTCLS